MRTNAGIIFDLFQAGVSRSKEGGWHASYRACKQDILAMTVLCMDAQRGRSWEDQWDVKKYLPFSELSPWSRGIGCANR